MKILVFKDQKYLRIDMIKFLIFYLIADKTNHLHFS